MPDEVERKPSNYIICLSCHYTSSLILVRCFPEDIDTHIRSAQFTWPQANVEIFGLAGEASKFVKGGIHLQLITRHGAKDYLRMITSSIRQFWAGKEGELMRHDIALVNEMLRDQMIRMTSKPEGAQ